MDGDRRDDDGGGGRASATARAVAAARAIGYRHLHDPLASAFLSAAGRALVDQARRLAALPGAADALGAATVGLTRHAALRMDAVDRAVRAAVAGGCAQVVVVGAGYDTRAWRLPELAGLDVVELDLPETQARKRRRVPAADRVVAVPVDLATTPVDEALAATSHRADRPTAWIWEAVAPYLPPEAVDATLAAIRRRSAPGSRLAMTVARPELLGPPALAPVTGPVAEVLFRAVGEPIRSTSDDWDTAAQLADHGFDDVDITDHDRWARDAGLSGRPDPFGAEVLVTAVTG